MKLALAIVAVLVLALIIAVRIPRSAEFLDDMPGIGWLVDLIGATHEDPGPVELRFRADHPEQLARVHLPELEVHGDTMTVLAHDELDAEMWRERIRHPRRPFDAYLVVYQSAELTSLQRALRKDDQAVKLGISIELDRVGYHLQIPSGGMYVNPDWAEQHHCDTRDRIVGTGVYCTVTAADRLMAYIKGDPGLFTDPHPIELPAGRTFVTDDVRAGERFYEVELPALTLDPTRVDRTDDALELAVGLPTLPSDAELVVVIDGKLVAATPHPGGVTVATGAGVADELVTAYALASAGLHELSNSRR